MPEVATIQQNTSLLSKMAQKFSVEPNKMLATLKSTAFKGDVTNEQMMALLIVADQYGLNPWTKEVFAFPDQKQGIIPVVGVDGWARIINSHPQFDGMTFEADNEKCTCTIYRKDRAHPVAVTEYLSECKRGTGPWGTHPRRMLRHKAMIQCARLAFGYAGIYDQDEAERIVEKDITPEADAPAGETRTEQVKSRMRSRRAQVVDAETTVSPPDTESLMDKVARVCAEAAVIVGHDEALAKLDEARGYLGEMLPENREKAEQLIASTAEGIRGK